MDAERSCKVQFPLYLFNGRDRPYPVLEAPPDGLWSRKYIEKPTLDAVWYLLQFIDKESRDKFIKFPGEDYKGALIQTPKQPFYDHYIKGEETDFRTWYI